MAVAVISACSAPSEEATVEARSAEALAGILAEAQETVGVDQSQIDILQSTEITFDQYQQAVHRHLTCMEDAGFPTYRPGSAERGGPIVERRNGQEILTWGFVVDNDETERVETIAAACSLRYLQFVDTYWQAFTPDTLAFNARLETALREPLFECLVDRELDVLDTAPFDDLWFIAITQPDVAGQENCLDVVGYSTWNG
jgi:hypothetical protein